MKRKIEKGVVFSEQREIPQNIPYSGFKFFYSRSCNFFDSNQITLKTNLDDTYDGIEQCWSKINFKKGVVLPEGITLKIDFFRDSKLFTLSPVTFLIVIR